MRYDDSKSKSLDKCTISSLEIGSTTIPGMGVELSLDSSKCEVPKWK